MEESPEGSDQELTTPGSRAWTYCRKFLTFLFSHIGLTCLVISYTIGGALLFMQIEEGEWMKDRQADLDTRLPPITTDPDFSEMAALSVAAWKASWMDDKVFRFYVDGQVINTVYPDDWSKHTAEDIRLWEVELNQYIINSVARMAAELAANRTAREMEMTSNKINAPNWSFPSAFLYALSVITTIGYGHVAPYTRWGKVATVFYAIMGIPIMLAFLTNIGDLLARSFRLAFEQLCLMKACRKAYRRRQRNSLVPSLGPSSVASSPSPIRIQKQSLVTTVVPGSSSAPRTSLASTHTNTLPVWDIQVMYDDPKEEKTAPVLLCVIIMGAYLFGGAVLFSVWERWNYLDGLYFCFITLSTIGFGDMIPGASVLNMDGGKGQLIACCLYILIGLAFLASCFNLLHDSAREGIKVVGKKIGLVKKKAAGSRRTSDANVV